MREAIRLAVFVLWCGLIASCAMPAQDSGGSVAITITPRKPESKWSEINRRRWNQLKADGLLAAPGLAAAPTRNSYAPKPAIPELPAYIAKAFKTNVKAWQHFQTLAPTTAVMSSCGFTSPSDQRLGKGAFASRLNCSRPARSSG